MAKISHCKEKYRGVSNEALIDLFQDENDYGALDEVIERHIPLVTSVALKYKNGEEFEDLVQTGAIGVMKAAERFDTKRDIPFGAYATIRIHGEIKDHFRSFGRVIKLPRSILTINGKVGTAINEFLSANHRIPTKAELAFITGYSESEIRSALDAVLTFDTLSLEKLIYGDENETELGGIVGFEDPGFEHIENKMMLKDLVGLLNKREKKVLYDYFFRGLSLMEIAKYENLTESRMSQIATRAKEKMQQKVCTEP